MNTDTSKKCGIFNLCFNFYYIIGVASKGCHYPENDRHTLGRRQERFHQFSYKLLKSADIPDGLATSIL
jgi:hypothetical protein